MLSLTGSNIYVSLRMKSAMIFIDDINQLQVNSASQISQEEIIVGCTDAEHLIGAK